MDLVENYQEKMYLHESPELAVDSWPTIDIDWTVTWIIILFWVL